MTMERFKKETMEASQQYWCTYYQEEQETFMVFFGFFIRLWRRTEGDDYETGDGLAQGSNYFQN
jgi:hypothetical protein